MRLLLVFSFATALMAQADYGRHHLTLGASAGVPVGHELNVYNPSAGLRLGYGYRFSRYVQADLGLDTLLNPAKKACSGHGCPENVKNAILFVPFGGRFILPLGSGRTEVYAGGGGARIHYTTSYAGYNSAYGGEWGGYGTAGASVGLGRTQRFRVGASTKYYHAIKHRAYVDDPYRAQHRWLQVFGDFGIRF